MSTHISMEEWNTALDEAERAVRKNDAPGYTVHELAERWGVKYEQARCRLKTLRDAGKVRITGKKYVPRTSGGVYPATAYELVKKK